MFKHGVKILLSSDLTVLFKCPAKCRSVALTSSGERHLHMRLPVYIEGVEGEGRRPPDWRFNLDFQNPTLTPSVGDFEFGCHFFVENGRIKYCSDCEHKFAGREVNMVRFTNRWDRSMLRFYWAEFEKAVEKYNIDINLVKGI